MDDRLAEIAKELGGSRLAAELFDASWHLTWVSSELKTLLGEKDEAKLGVGDHVIVARTNALWSQAATTESQLGWSHANVPYILAETSADVLEDLSRLEFDNDPRLSADLSPRPSPAVWSYPIEYRRPGFAPMRITCVAVRLNDTDGSRIGTANVYAPALSAATIDLLSRGDERMFERMARLIEPGRRESAILFADLQASGAVSRRLSSAAYFRLIRSLTTAIDAVVGEFGGVVGKHAGDGVTAFFLGDDLGSPSAAARAAVEAARGIGDAARGAAAEAGVEGLVDADVPMNIGLHWSGALYMGQVVTGGRLEVTALGDEMNECARIQQTARGGAVLASKALVERLGPGDASEIGVDPDAIAYRTVAELPGAGEKAIRDAGGVAVAQLAG